MLFAIEWENIAQADEKLITNTRQEVFNHLIAAWEKEPSNPAMPTAIQSLKKSLTDIFNDIESQAATHDMPAFWPGPLLKKALETKTALIEALQKIAGMGSTPHKFYAACVLGCLAESLSTCEDDNAGYINFNKIEEAAEQGFAPANYLLGLYHESNTKNAFDQLRNMSERLGTPSNGEIKQTIENNREYVLKKITQYQTALGYFEAASNQGLVIAQLKLATLNATGFENQVYCSPYYPSDEEKALVLPNLGMTLSRKEFIKSKKLDQVIAPNLGKALIYYHQANQQLLAEEKPDPKTLDIVTTCTSQLKKTIDELANKAPISPEQQRIADRIDAANECAEAISDMSYTHIKEFLQHQRVTYSIFRTNNQTELGAEEKSKTKCIIM